MKYTRTFTTFHDVVDDPTLDIVDFVHLSEHLDRIVTRKKPEFARSPQTNNLPVAMFVTSYARLCLYDRIDEVDSCGGIALYCDTDSVFYARKIGNPGAIFKRQSKFFLSKVIIVNYVYNVIIIRT